MPYVIQQGLQGEAIVNEAIVDTSQEAAKYKYELARGGRQVNVLEITEAQRGNFVLGASVGFNSSRPDMGPSPSAQLTNVVYNPETRTYTRPDEVKAIRDIQPQLAKGSIIYENNNPAASLKGSSATQMSGAEFNQRRADQLAQTQINASFAYGIPGGAGTQAFAYRQQILSEQARPQYQDAIMRQYPHPSQSQPLGAGTQALQYRDEILRRQEQMGVGMAAVDYRQRLLREQERTKGLNIDRGLLGGDGRKNQETRQGFIGNRLIWDGNNFERNLGAGSDIGSSVVESPILEAQKNFEERVLNLRQKERDFFNSEGFKRIGQTASLLTFGGGKPLEQRGFIGQRTERLVRAGLEIGPSFFGQAYFGGGKLAATAEAFRFSETRKNIPSFFSEPFTNPELKKQFDPRTPEGFVTYTFAGLGAAGATIRGAPKPFESFKPTELPFKVQTFQDTAVMTLEKGATLKGKPITGQVVIADTVTGEGTARFKIADKYNVYQTFSEEGGIITKVKRGDKLISETTRPFTGEDLTFKRIYESRRNELRGIRQLPEEPFSLYSGTEIIESQFKGGGASRVTSPLTETYITQEGQIGIRTKIGQEIVASDKKIRVAEGKPVLDFDTGKTGFQIENYIAENIKPEFVREPVTKEPYVRILEKEGTKTRIGDITPSDEARFISQYKFGEGQYTFKSEKEFLPAKRLGQMFESKRGSLSFEDSASVLERFAKPTKVEVVRGEVNPQLKIKTGFDIKAIEPASRSTSTRVLASRVTSSRSRGREKQFEEEPVGTRFIENVRQSQREQLKVFTQNRLESSTKAPTRTREESKISIPPRTDFKTFIDLPPSIGVKQTPELAPPTTIVPKIKIPTTTPPPFVPRATKTPEIPRIDIPFAPGLPPVALPKGREIGGGFGRAPRSKQPFSYSGSLLAEEFLVFTKSLKNLSKKRFTGQEIRPVQLPKGFKIPTQRRKRR